MFESEAVILITSCRFRDPVHGFIEIRPWEEKIIDSKPFQRLRRIKQLSLTYLVYHGAEHTRFGHSLGVMHLVSRAFRAVVTNTNRLFTPEQSEWYEQILRLIALTHDLGHAPFSHGSESVFPEGLEHEDFTYKIILNTEIAGYITEMGSDYQDGNNKFLAIDRGGVHAFEEFVLARYFMFVQVYFHKTRRFLDKMLVDFLQDSLPGGKYPKDVSEYLGWDDGAVWEKIQQSESKLESASRLINRRIMKCVYESPTHSNLQEIQKYNMIKADLKRMIGEEHLLLDSADKMTHKIPLRHELNDEKSIPIILNHSEQPSTIGQESEIIGKMTEPINILRIYAKEDLCGKAETAVRQKMKDMSGE